MSSRLPLCVSLVLVFRDGYLILLYVLRLFGIETGSAQHWSRRLQLIAAQHLSRRSQLIAAPNVVTKLVVLSP